ncbi:MAG: ATPase [Proteobacteria bacterium]|nr:ATPase [Pseudomonadota bacterium]
MKRFYKEAKAAKGEDGFAVLLDGKNLRTPGGQFLILPNLRLAESIAEEWQAQKDDIRPATMPLMQLTATVLDHLSSQRAAMTERLLSCVETDVLCLRAETPPELRVHQEKHWQPPLDWLKKTHGIELKTGLGLKAPRLSSAAQAAFERKLSAFDNWVFMGVYEAAAGSGSLVLALALYEKELNAQQVFELAELERIFQAQKWGSDAEMEKRRNAVRAELAVIERWFGLLC